MRLLQSPPQHSHLVCAAGFPRLWGRRQMEIRPLQRASSWRWLTCHVVRPVEWPAPALRALSRVHPAHRLPGRPLHVPAPGSTWVRCVFGRPRPGRGAIPRHVALPVTVGAAAALRLPVWPTAPAARLRCQRRRYRTTLVHSLRTKLRCSATAAALRTLRLGHPRTLGRGRRHPGARAFPL